MTNPLSQAVALLEEGKDREAEALLLAPQEGPLEAERLALLGFVEARKGNLRAYRALALEAARRAQTPLTLYHLGLALPPRAGALALARGGLLRLLFLRAGVNMLFILVRTTFLFAVLLLVTGVQLQPNPWWALCLPPLLLAGLGLALFLGGLTLIFRQVGNAVSFLQFLLIPYFLSLANWQPYMAYLPIAPAAQAANLALTRKTLDQGLLLLGLVQGVLLFLLGFFLLLWMYTLVRRRGIFGRF